MHKNANLLHSKKGLLQLSIDLNFCQWVVQILQIFWKHLTISTIDSFHAKKKKILRADNIIMSTWKRNSLIFKTIALWYSSLEFINIINNWKKKEQQMRMCSLSISINQKKNVCLKAFSDNLSYQKQTAIVILYKVHYIYIYLQDFKTLKWIIQLLGYKIIFKYIICTGNL